MGQAFSKACGVKGQRPCRRRHSVGENCAVCAKTHRLCLTVNWENIIKSKGMVTKMGLDINDIKKKVEDVEKKIPDEVKEKAKELATKENIDKVKDAASNLFKK